MTGPVRFFESRNELRAWFEMHHASERELWVGFYKAHTGRTGVGYPEAVEEALCFGWIDTTVRRIDEDRYTNRFVPRAPGGHWTATNRALFRALARAGKVVTAGRAAFDGGGRPRERPSRNGYRALPRGRPGSHEQKGQSSLAGRSPPSPLNSPKPRRRRRARDDEGRGTHRRSRRA